MSLTAYVGSTLNEELTLSIQSTVVRSLESANKVEWEAPAQLSLCDSDGIIYLQVPILNPEPRIIGSKLDYDYNISILIPEVPSGIYQLTLTRWTVTNTYSLTIEGGSNDAYGAENVVALNTDEEVRWGLFHDDKNATVTWQLPYKRLDGRDISLTGDTVKSIQGTDAYYTNKSPLRPQAEGIKASMQPMTILWTISNGTPVPSRQTSSLFIINISQLSFITGVKDFFDRIMEQKRLPELEYTLADYARWAKNGMDMFNSEGLFTSFNMTDATDTIQQSWYVCTLIWALRNMFLLEGQRSFSFSGQSVTLDVDTTSYLQSILGELQTQWDSNKISLKQQLKQYGMTGGSGNMNQASFQRGAVGLNVGPASNIGNFFSSRSYPTIFGL